MKKRVRKLVFWLTMYIAAAGASTMAGGEGDLCTVTERSGYVAVLRKGREEALTDIGACHLPEEDRERLRSGIPVSSREELLLLLEDLGS